ncbi:MAG: DUF5700 domain-containing putative Zn-dependent protease [Burkholderiaceae bacterium]
MGEASLTLQDWHTALTACSPRSRPCVDVPPFQLTRLRENATSSDALLTRIEREKETWENGIVQRVFPYLPAVSDTMDLTIYLVGGTRSAGFVVDVEGTFRMAIDVGLVAGIESEKTREQFEATADHELWHLGFMTHVRNTWKNARPDLSNDAFERLAFKMVNEGFGYFMSFKRLKGSDSKVDDTLRSRFSAGETRSSLESSLKEGVAKILAAPRAKASLELVDASDVADSTFDRWSAMAGAIAISTVIREKGLTAVLESIRIDPYALWSLYESCERQYLVFPREFFEEAKRRRFPEPGVVPVEWTQNPG